MRIYQNINKIEDIRKAVISSIENFESLYGPIDELDHSLGFIALYTREMR